MGHVVTAENQRDPTWQSLAADSLVQKAIIPLILDLRHWEKIRHLTLTAPESAVGRWAEEMFVQCWLCQAKGSKAPTSPATNCS